MIEQSQDQCLGENDSRTEAKKKRTVQRTGSSMVARSQRTDEEMVANSLPQSHGEFGKREVAVIPQNLLADKNYKRHCSDSSIKAKNLWLDKSKCSGEYLQPLAESRRHKGFAIITEVDDVTKDTCKPLASKEPSHVCIDIEKKLKNPTPSSHTFGEDPLSLQNKKTLQSGDEQQQSAAIKGSAPVRRNIVIQTQEMFSVFSGEENLESYESVPSEHQQVEIQAKKQTPGVNGSGVGEVVSDKGEEVASESGNVVTHQSVELQANKQTPSVRENDVGEVPVDKKQAVTSDSFNAVANEHQQVEIKESSKQTPGVNENDVGESVVDPKEAVSIESINVLTSEGQQVEIEASNQKTGNESNDGEIIVDQRTSVESESFNVVTSEHQQLEIEASYQSSRVNESGGDQREAVASAESFSVVTSELQQLEIDAHKQTACVNENDVGETVVDPGEAVSTESITVGTSDSHHFEIEGCSQTTGVKGSDIGESSVDQGKAVASGSVNAVTSKHQQLEIEEINETDVEEIVDQNQAVASKSCNVVSSQHQQLEIEADNQTTGVKESDVGEIVVDQWQAVAHEGVTVVTGEYQQLEIEANNQSFGVNKSDIGEIVVHQGEAVASGSVNVVASEHQLVEIESNKQRPDVDKSDDGQIIANQNQEVAPESFNFVGQQFETSVQSSGVNKSDVVVDQGEAVVSGSVYCVLSDHEQVQFEEFHQEANMHDGPHNGIIENKSQDRMQVQSLSSINCDDFDPASVCNQMAEGMVADDSESQLVCTSKSGQMHLMFRSTAVSPSKFQSLQGEGSQQTSTTIDSGLSGGLDDQTQDSNRAKGPKRSFKFHSKSENKTSLTGARIAPNTDHVDREMTADNSGLQCESAFPPKEIGINFISESILPIEHQRLQVDTQEPVMRRNVSREGLVEYQSQNQFPVPCWTKSEQIQGTLKSEETVPIGDQQAQAIKSNKAILIVENDVEMLEDPSRGSDLPVTKTTGGTSELHMDQTVRNLDERLPSRKSSHVHLKLEPKGSLQGQEDNIEKESVRQATVMTGGDKDQASSSSKSGNPPLGVTVDERQEAQTSKVGVDVHDRNQPPAGQIQDRDSPISASKSVQAELLSDASGTLRRKHEAEETKNSLNKGDVTETSEERMLVDKSELQLGSPSNSGQVHLASEMNRAAPGRYGQSGHETLSQTGITEIAGDGTILGQRQDLGVSSRKEFRQGVRNSEIRTSLPNDIQEMEENRSNQIVTSTGSANSLKVADISQGQLVGLDKESGQVHDTPMSRSLLHENRRIQADKSTQTVVMTEISNDAVQDSEPATCSNCARTSGLTHLKTEVWKKLKFSTRNLKGHTGLVCGVDCRNSVLVSGG